jgi:hypothetical protein
MGVQHAARRGGAPHGALMNATSGVGPRSR